MMPFTLLQTWLSFSVAEFTAAQGPRFQRQGIEPYLTLCQTLPRKEPRQLGF
jgi:hypothetical protein